MIHGICYSLARCARYPAVKVPLPARNSTSIPAPSGESSTPAARHDNPSTIHHRKQPRKPTRRLADAHDVLRSVLAPEGQTVLVSRPSGSSAPGPFPFAGGSARGELRGGVPLLNTTGGPVYSPAQPQASGSHPLPANSITPPQSLISSTPIALPSYHAHGVSRSHGTELQRADAEEDAPALPSRRAPVATTPGEEEDDEPSLLQEYGVEGADAGDLLGYEDDSESEDDDEEDTPSDEEAQHEAFKKSVRVKAVRRAEGNRRAGGLKTQKAMVKAWDVRGYFLSAPSRY